MNFHPRNNEKTLKNTLTTHHSFGISQALNRENVFLVISPRTKQGGRKFSLLAHEKIKFINKVTENLAKEENLVCRILLNKF